MQLAPITRPVQLVVQQAMQQILDMGTTKAARAIGLTVDAVDWHLRLGKPDALRSLAVRMLDRNTA